MTGAVMVRFFTTLIGAGAGMYLGAGVGVVIYDLTGDPDGFELLGGAIVGAPIGLFIGSLLGNWVGRLVHRAERLRTHGRRRAPVLIEGLLFSLGFVVPLLQEISGSPLGDLGAWMFALVCSVAGFVLGVHLADRKLESSSEGIRERRGSS